MCVDVLLCLYPCVWMGSPGQRQHCCYDFTWGGYQIHHHVPKQEKTHTLSASHRLSLMCLVQAEYGNVVKWPTGNSVRIRDYRDFGSQGDSPTSEFRYRPPFSPDACCNCLLYKTVCIKVCVNTGTYIHVLLGCTVHLNVCQPCLLHVCMCISGCVCLCWTQNQWSEKQKAHPAIWLQS